MSDIIPIPSIPVTPPLDLFAASELEQVNSSLARRIDEHRNRFSAFWRTYQWTPDEILQKFGTSAAIWLQAAAESVNHINNLAQIVGKTVADFLPSSDYVPPRSFIVGQDGSVTLSPIEEGYDAWGRPVIPSIVPPEPIPEVPVIVPEEIVFPEE